MHALTPTIHAYFEDFVATFATFDGQRIAQKFALPYMAQNAQGERRVFTHLAELQAYFQHYLNDYQQQGCCQCLYQDLQIQPIDAHSALATVTWQLLDAAQQRVLSWRESYVLHVVEHVAYAVMSLDHAF